VHRYRHLRGHRRSDWYGARIQVVGLPGGGEHEVVSGDLDGERFVALDREGDELSRALTSTGSATP
jgi:hypothetical protein